jgi:hypothetical protein
MPTGMARRLFDGLRSFFRSGLPPRDSISKFDMSCTMPLGKASLPDGLHWFCRVFRTAILQYQ